MQRRKHDVAAEEPAGGLQRQLTAIDKPTTVPSYLDRDGVVPALLEAVAHSGRGRKRHSVFLGTATTEDDDAHQVEPLGPLPPVEDEL
jgi:hypothetical protein